MCSHSEYIKIHNLRYIYIHYIPLCSYSIKIIVRYTPLDYTQYICTAQTIPCDWLRVIKHTCSSLRGWLVRSRLGEACTADCTANCGPWLQEDHI